MKKSGNHMMKKIEFDPVHPIGRDYLNSRIIENSRFWNCERELSLEKGTWGQIYGDGVTFSHLFIYDYSRIIANFHVSLFL